ncbi:hypothetical protein Hanom_Chr16g01492951 [Helianthus anomalus]
MQARHMIILYLAMSAPSGKWKRVHKAVDAFKIVSRDLHYNKVSSAFMCCIFLKII